MADRFAMTYDYLCPFARNANESVVDGLRGGAGWEVDFRPFSLAQTKVEEGDRPVWEREPGAADTSGVLALQWSIAVRDRFPDAFPEFHVGLFDARPEQGEDIGDERVLASVATRADVVATDINAVVATGEPARRLAEEHGELVKRWAVFGVPTFVVGDEAVFVRCMERHRPDEIQRIVDMIAWTELNEFKRTRIPR